jgi:hypothetical protein
MFDHVGFFLHVKIDRQRASNRFLSTIPIQSHSTNQDSEALDLDIREE